MARATKKPSGVVFIQDTTDVTDMGGEPIYVGIWYDDVADDLEPRASEEPLYLSCQVLGLSGLKESRYDSSRLATHVLYAGYEFDKIAALLRSAGNDVPTSGVGSFIRRYREWLRRQQKT